MSSTFRIDYAEAALIALLRQNLASEYSAPVDVESLGSKDFDEDDTLVLDPPAARVRYVGSKFDTLRDNKRLTYQVPHMFEILAFESSARDKADERLQTLQLVAAILDQLAGARLGLQDGTTSMPIAIVSVDLVVTQAGPVDQLFSILIAVEGIAQFSGVNA